MYNYLIPQYSLLNFQDSTNVATQIFSSKSVISFEIILVIIVFSLQIWAFIFTLRKIRQLKSIFPGNENYTISKEFVLTSMEDIKAEEDGVYEATIIKSKVSNSKIFNEILSSINNYLRHNKGAVSDFSLIKDIVDRNCDAIDEEINTTLPVPIYLGLAGTMAGIIIGLWCLPSVQSDGFLKGEGIDILLGGVKIAMMASFLGLGLTTFNSGIIYKISKSIIEKRKNDFFTFIQVNLLPILSQNVTSSLYSLQNNLIRFNEGFSGNINKFENIMNNIHKSFSSQQELVEKLNEMDIAQVANLNINVLKQLQSSTKEFGKFNIYLQNVNGFIENSVTLNSRINDLLERSDNFKLIAEKIDQTFTINQDLLNFLSASLKDLGSHRQVMKDTVSDVSDTLKKSLDQLREVVNNQNDQVTKAISDISGSLTKNLDELQSVTNEKCNSIKSITIEEIDFIKSEKNLLEKYLSENKNILDEHLKIANLSFTSKLLEGLNELEKVISEKYLSIKNISNAEVEYIINEKQQFEKFLLENRNTLIKLNYLENLDLSFTKFLDDNSITQKLELLNNNITKTNEILTNNSFKGSGRGKKIKTIVPGNKGLIRRISSSVTGLFKSKIVK